MLHGAVGKHWGQGYNYDAFGNLTAKTVLAGSVPTMSVGVDASTNRLIGYSYDANGNVLTHPTAGTLTYDVENRLLTAGSNAYRYGYDSTNKRIWASTPSGESYFFYGPGGRQLGKYTPSVNGTAITFATVYTRAYFGRRLVSQDGTHPFIQDRTHSLRVDAVGNRCATYPYGEDKGTPCATDQVKFATYTRDSGTQLDYADQRFYTYNYGRFLTPDRFRGSGRVGVPQSWNRYGYAAGDPLNRTDPTGRQPLCEYDVEGFLGEDGVCSGGEPPSGGGGLHSGQYFEDITGIDYGNGDILYTDPRLVDISSTYVNVTASIADANVQTLASNINENNPGGFINGVGLVMSPGLLLMAPTLLPTGGIQTLAMMGGPLVPPILTAATQTGQVRQAIDYVNQLSGTAAEKAAALEDLFRQIQQNPEFNWSFTTPVSADESYIFVGPGGHSTVISATGQIFRAPALSSSDYLYFQQTPNGMIPNYFQFTPVPRQ